MKRFMKKSRKISQKPSPSFSSNKNERLYQSLLFIYKFEKFEDFLELKEKYFLDLCEVQSISWNLNKKHFTNDVLLKDNNSKNLEASPFCFKCPLEYQNKNYGDLIFISSQKITQVKKNFLKKISYFVASSIHFLENKLKLESTKYEWQLTFDCFYQPLCLTDANFQILRVNQSFCQLLKFSKKQSIGQSFFKILPFSIEKPPEHLKDHTWISRSFDKQDLSFQFSLKTIYLKNKNIPFKLLLIKDMTEEYKMEKLIAQKIRNKDLGLIKGSIAHEINNPIAGIKTLLYMIEKNLDPKDAEIKNIFKEMNEALQRCQTIIKNLLSVSHKTVSRKNRDRPMEVNP